MRFAVGTGLSAAKRIPLLLIFMVLPEPLVPSDFFPVTRYRSSLSMGKRTPERRSAGRRVSRSGILVSEFSKCVPANDSVRNLLFHGPALQVRDGMNHQTIYGWDALSSVLVPICDSRRHRLDDLRRVCVQQSIQFRTQGADGVQCVFAQSPTR